jgi:hypothetical protein
VGPEMSPSVAKHQRSVVVPGDVRDVDAVVSALKVNCG